jgi:hypothetical protein
VEPIVIGKEDFPIDNLYGSEPIVIQQEITKEYTSSLNIDTGALLSAGFTTKCVSILESEVRAGFSRQVSHSMGTTTTRRQQVQFSVGARESVVYTVIWRAQAQEGTYSINLNGKSYGLAYHALYGLSFDISSKPKI